MDAARAFNLGYADDEQGLTPAVYWANASLLHCTPSSELKDVIARLLASTESVAAFLPAPCSSSLGPIAPTTTLHLRTLCSLSQHTRSTELASAPSVLITISSETNLCLSPSGDRSATSIKHMHLALPPLKLGSRRLRTLLPSVLEFVSASIAPDSSTTHHLPIFIFYPGEDLDHAIGVALAILVLYYDDNGQQCGLGTNKGLMVTKKLIRKRLNWILQRYPEAKVSRATLTAVNEVVMARPG